MNSVTSDVARVIAKAEAWLRESELVMKAFAEPDESIEDNEAMSLIRSLLAVLREAEERAANYRKAYLNVTDDAGIFEDPDDGESSAPENP